MNCQSAEQLIPLFSGGDLKSQEAERVRLHLENCAHCCQVAEEFAASQAWLSEFAAPEFDEAVFADLRASVRREIQATEERGRRSWIDWLLPRWNPRLAFAAVAVLILLAGLAAVVYRTKPSSRETTVAGGEKPKTAMTPLPPTPQIEQGQAFAGVPPKLSPANRQGHKSQRLTPDVKALLTESPTTDLTAQSQNVPSPTTEPAANSDLTASVSEREMLRIELQTKDPNIRIIWLAPKSDSTPNSK